MSSFRFRSTLLPLTALATTLAATGALTPALAQEPAAEERGIAEITVTARKREESINEVPLAISAFDADAIARRNIESLSDVAKYTAGFSFENFAGGVTPAPIIRGLTQNTLTDRNQNVGTFVDGIHIQQQGNIDFNLLDVERIEVLKGPQNAQYGRSAFAGAINYVSKKPLLGEVDADAALTLGSDERSELRAGISVPLWEDKLAMRLYGVTSEFDGTWHNNFAGGDQGVWTRDAGFGNTFDGTDGNLGGWDNDGYQAQLRFAPLDVLRFDLGYFKSNVNNEQSALEFIRPNGSTIWGLDHQTNCNPNATGLLRFVCGELEVNSESVTVDPRSVGLYAETQLINFDTAWDITDAITASYQFGRNDLDSNSFGHSSNPPNPELEGCGVVGSGVPPCATGDPRILFQTGPTAQKATSHELRFDGRLFADTLTWRLGYYHSEVEDLTYLNSVETRRSLIQDPTGQIVVQALPQPASLFNDETNAVFGSVGYTFLDIYTLDVEARYAAEERELTPPNPAQKLDPRTFYDFTPRVSLKAQVTPDSMVYVSGAKGSKAGGFNTVTADPGFETYDQETNWTYELGAKQTLLDGTLQLNYDVFYIDWTDLQLSTADLVPSTNTGAADANYITNASGASSWGVELEAVYLITDNWTLNFAGSVAKPEFDSGTLDFGLGAQCANSTDPVCPSVVITRPGLPDALASPIGGNQLARTPEVKLAGGLEYRSMLADWEYAVRGDLSYQDKQYAEVLNLAWLPSRLLLDLNLTMTMPNRHWTFSLWGKNVGNEEYVSNSFVIGFNNTYGASLAPGASWGLTARYNFAGR